MHAFLITGTNKQALKKSANILAGNLKATLTEYPLAKIEDVRSLNSMVGLSVTEPTIIYCENINEATTEALNAFLKNLEEPQANIYFALTAPGIKTVLPTIVSRCQIIKSQKDTDETRDDTDTENFLKMSTAKKLDFTGAIRKREGAIELVVNTLYLLHRKLHSDRVKYTEVAENIETADKTLTRLKATGNVNLQLADFSIKLI